MLLFSVIFCVMLAFTVQATLVRSVFDNASLMADVWFQATFVDAYLGFLTFYVWVAWKERTISRRIGWFVLIMTLGNMAMAGYVLLQLRLLRPDDTVETLLTKRSPS
jgi:hypothetical protein